MKYTLFFFASLLALAACNNTTNTSTHTDSVKTSSIAKAAPAAPSIPDSALITQPCAILYFMNDIKVAAAKKKEGEGNFEEGIDDALYYMAGARDTLQKLGAKVIDTVGEKLNFKLADGSVYKLNLHSRDHVCELYLFDGKNKPVLSDLVDPVPDYDSLLHK